MMSLMRPQFWFILRLPFYGFSINFSQNKKITEVKAVEVPKSRRTEQLCCVQYQYARSLGEGPLVQLLVYFRKSFSFLQEPKASKAADLLAERHMKKEGNPVKDKDWKRALANWNLNLEHDLSYISGFPVSYLIPLHAWFWLSSYSITLLL